MVPHVRLTEVSREDVERLTHWLDDEEIKGLWYGSDESGDPLHIGYSPLRMLSSTPDEWERVFNDEDRKIFSIYDAKEGHIGEAQMVIEPPLHEAQVFVIIGRKDLWHHHFGSAAMLHILDLTFYTYKLHRAWVDVPDYNIHAQQMCEHLGFLLEGHLRSTHPKDGEWFDSMVMGILESEFTRRRERMKGLPS
jgi:RimJ/RimL family protein N-acetyltransferase